jgi:molybdopterin synthase catalytic subunit/molybdopterin converting factor small subunit
LALVKVRVSYYAAARELAGCDSSTFEFEAEGVGQAELRLAVAERFPALSAFLARMRLAVNGEFSTGSEELRDGDKVDVLPPVAGGSRVVSCRVIDAEISIDDTRKAVEHSGAGAVCTFCGLVRDHAEGKDVVRLDYEAHESLAEKEMRRVLDGVVAEHPEVRLAAVHRVGSLRIGDVAVCVAASAPHRKEAFEACQKAIDRIKESVPLWKKEWGSDGQAHWVNLGG